MKLNSSTSTSTSSLKSSSGERKKQTDPLQNNTTPAQSFPDSIPKRAVVDKRQLFRERSMPRRNNLIEAEKKPVQWKPSKGSEARDRQNPRINLPLRPHVNINFHGSDLDISGDHGSQTTDDIDDRSRLIEQGDSSSLSFFNKAGKLKPPKSKNSRFGNLISPRKPQKPVLTELERMRINPPTTIPVLPPANDLSPGDLADIIKDTILRRIDGVDASSRALNILYCAAGGKSILNSCPEIDAYADFLRSLEGASAHIHLKKLLKVLSPLLKATSRKALADFKLQENNVGELKKWLETQLGLEPTTDLVIELAPAKAIEVTMDNIVEIFQQSGPIGLLPRRALNIIYCAAGGKSDMNGSVSSPENYAFTEFLTNLPDEKRLGYANTLLKKLSEHIPHAIQRDINDQLAKRAKNDDFKDLLDYLDDLLGRNQ